MIRRQSVKIMFVLANLKKIMTFQNPSIKSTKISLPFRNRWIIYDIWFNTEPGRIKTEFISI